MATTQTLTEREQEALEHMLKAQELGSTLKGYAAKIGLDIQQLYELRRRLVRKGAFGPPPRRKDKESGKAGAFLPVRVVPAVPVPSSRSVTCRLVHPSGWVLECDGLPPASWMATVLAGGAHAAA
jgi:hypothetical protein